MLTIINHSDYIMLLWYAQSEKMVFAYKKQRVFANSLDPFYACLKYMQENNNWRKNRIFYNFNI